MKVNFNRPILQLDGTPFKQQSADGTVAPDAEDLLMNKVLAFNLSRVTRNFDPMKAYELSMALFKGEELTLDKSDQEALKTLIKTGFEDMIAIVRGQLLAVLMDKDPA